MGWVAKGPANGETKQKLPRRIERAAFGVDGGGEDAGAKRTKKKKKKSTRRVLVVRYDDGGSKRTTGTSVEVGKSDWTRGMDDGPRMRTRRMWLLVEQRWRRRSSVVWRRCVRRRRRRKKRLQGEDSRSRHR